MRRLRVFMGPVYVLYSVRSFYLTYLDLGPVSPWVCTLSFASATLACVGGVIFRPDNGLMLNVLFRWHTEHAQRKVIHPDKTPSNSVYTGLYHLELWHFPPSEDSNSK
uniref:Uncharacterized protein n=1 Tax=Magallana gigas TaxID=29159 RepID=K1QRY2_MAGGI